jgi:pyrroloquinoline quinone (PQQ) biosynthesis protein C
MDVIAGIDAARERWNVLEHPFYTRWEQGELTQEELTRYAAEYRHAVVALARAAHTARLHAHEEAEHIALWDDFASALSADEHNEPLPETRCCANAWAAADDELGAAAILYAIEASQPAISETKLRGLLDHYGFSEGSSAVEYFAVHGERDHEHAAEARTVLAEADDERLVHLAEAALAANWALLDGVSQN